VTCFTVPSWDETT